MTRHFRNPKLRCGDIVVDIDDERHLGRVEAIRSGAFALVKWSDTGWTSEVPVERLKRVDNGSQRKESTVRAKK
jgi:hypothetical protein